MLGEVSYIASCNVLAVNHKIIHSKVFRRDFCFVMKITSCRSTCTTWRPRPAPPVGTPRRYVSDAYGAYLVQQSESSRAK